MRVQLWCHTLHLILRSIAQRCVSKDGRRKESSHDFAFPRHDLSEVCIDVHPLREKGAGNARCQAAPIASCAKVKKHTSPPQDKPNTGIPCAMVLTLLRALPGVHDLVSHRRAQARHLHAWHQPRDARTTRLCRPPARRPSSKRARVHRSPSHVRDDAYAPSQGTGCDSSSMTYEKKKQDSLNRKKKSDGALK